MSADATPCAVFRAFLSFSRALMMVVCSVYGLWVCGPGCPHTFGHKGLPIAHLLPREVTVLQMAKSMWTSVSLQCSDFSSWSDWSADLSSVWHRWASIMCHHTGELNSSRPVWLASPLHVLLSEISCWVLVGRTLGSQLHVTDDGSWRWFLMEHGELTCVCLTPSSLLIVKVKFW